VCTSRVCSVGCLLSSGHHGTVPRASSGSSWIVASECAHSLVVVGLVGVFMAVLLAGLLTLVSWLLEMASSRQPSPGSPPDPSGKAAQRLASADPTGSSSQISRDPPHTAEAARRRLSRPRLSSLKPPHRRTVARAGNPEIAAPLTVATSGLPRSFITDFVARSHLA
jgi:hypothetical protein